MSNVKIDIKEVTTAIDKELGEMKSGQIQNKALNKGSELVADNLKNTLGKFVGTGYSKGHTRDEIVVQKARKTNDGRSSSIGWNGPKERYRLIHLNEFGYTRKGKKYRPRMQGTVTQTVAQSESRYYDAVYKELKKGYER